MRLVRPVFLTQTAWWSTSLVAGCVGFLGPSYRAKPVQVPPDRGERDVASRAVLARTLKSGDPLEPGGANWGEPRQLPEHHFVLRCVRVTTAAPTLTAVTITPVVQRGKPRHKEGKPLARGGARPEVKGQDLSPGLGSVFRTISLSWADACSQPGENVVAGA